MSQQSIDATKYIPYVLGGASFAISCYALYQSSHTTNNIKPPKQKSSHTYSPSLSIDVSTSPHDETINGSATLSRLMLPDDANSSGNVHGGTILKMIGHTGFLSATRYLNRTINQSKQNNHHEYRGVLVRMEEMSFKLPMFIGEICICNAKVTFTSNQSIEVQVIVTAENAITGNKRITNTANMWFVGVTTKINKQNLVKIPSLKYQSNTKYEFGKQRYQKQKQSRNKDEQINILKAIDLNEWTDRLISKDPFDKRRSGSTVFKLAQVTLPSDCFATQDKTIDGGYVMKLMDSVAGCVACGWSKSRCVTIHINAIDFHAPVDAGNVCHCYGRLVFTSKRSMEICVLAFAHSNNNSDCDDDDNNIYKTLGHHELKLVCSAFFTFVALNDDNPPKSIDVPLFTPCTSFEEMMYNEAKLRYKERKKTRKQCKKPMDKYKPTVVVGPSGVGKGTLLKVLKDHFADRFAVAVSHTTRRARMGEEDGIHYNFVSKEEFESEIRKNKFIEYASTYGNLYGTSSKAVQDVIDNKSICLLEIDYVGAKLIKQSSIDANYLFITVNGEHETCRERIKGRGSETEQQIEKRVQTAKIEFEFFNNNPGFFDASISNDDLTESGKEIIELFKKWYVWL